VVSQQIRAKYKLKNARSKRKIGKESEEKMIRKEQ